MLLVLVKYFNTPQNAWVHQHTTLSITKPLRRLRKFGGVDRRGQARQTFTYYYINPASAVVDYWQDACNASYDVCKGELALERSFSISANSGDKRFRE
jgi:hypothetical protein